MKETYRCWAEIDRDALRHNARIVRQRIGSAEMLAVVKANGYGHGLLGVAQALADDAQLFGVANLEEALALRESLPHPIVILGPAIPEERSIIAEHGFIPTISSLEEAQAFDQPAHVRHRASWHHAVRDFAAPGISEAAQASDDMEDANFTRARHAQRQLYQLWPHLHNAEKNADRNLVGWLCRWLSLASFQSRRRRPGTRATLRPYWPGNNGLDDGRRERHRQCAGWRRSHSDGARWKRGNFMHGTGRKGRHDHVGNYHPDRRAGAASICLNGRLGA